MAVMVAALAASAVVVASPAAAHVCVTPVEVDVGVLSAINIGVPAEDRPVVKVAVDVPPGFQLEEARGARGWTVEREGATVRYTGGEIPAAQCGYFTVTGTATRRARLVFPVTTTDAAGATVQYGPDRLGAQEVYAGMEASPDDGGGVDIALVAGVVLVAAGIAGAVVLAVRRAKAA